ncbi:hypothetical protein HPB50_006414 [Hyalomma asiaticum]|uniref:Uncharacterized protein n=1 Tax=Hyalomma asiaticum TaxID=266040 RepID=A0ACB7TCA0_HYAAI|nr:hypothetical protein HPB50_006414 [Hyalomma asiaticum]
MAAAMRGTYSTADYVDMVIAYVQAQGDVQLATSMYCTRRPDTPIPLHKVFKRTFERFCFTGSVNVRRGRKNNDVAVNGDFEIDLLAFVSLNPEASVREMAQATGATSSKVWRTLSKYKYHPCHVSLHQEFSERDHRQRLDFSNWYLIQCDENP